MSIPKPSSNSNHIFTAHSDFLLPSKTPNHPPTSLLLRGVNLTSKFPSTSPLPRISEGTDATRAGRDEIRARESGVESHYTEEDANIWTEAENGGRDGWFVGHPLVLDGAETHLNRLKAWGFTTIRLLVTWEALEHAGPGKYDEPYIGYLIDLLRLLKKHDFRVFISPHQDVFSRFISGSGAPYWALQAMGINPRRIHQTGAALVHSQWAKYGWGGIEGQKETEKGDLGDFPDMVWNTNLNRLASRHCFTMFFASEVYAPKCKIDGVPVGEYLRTRWVDAYGHLADRFREAGDILDDCLIGWDSMNEPHEGFVGMPALDAIPESQDFRKGPSPSPIQGFKLGVGQPVADIAYDDFTALGLRRKGYVKMTPPEGQGLWLTRSEAGEAAQRWGWKCGDEWDFWDANGDKGCIWAGHGVWNREDGTLIKSDYFTKSPHGGKVDYINDFWRPLYESYITRIRISHPGAISFINPPIFDSPPDLSEEVKQGRMALSSHFYDGLTMLGKRRHMFNADAVGLKRGIKSLLTAIRLGSASVRTGIREQFEELKSDAEKVEGIAEKGDDGPRYPTIIGETGVPFDMKKTGLLGLGKGKEDCTDYREPSKAMDEILNGCDGENALSYTIWVYEPNNTHERGDGWNGEDFSLFSYDDARLQQNKNNPITSTAQEVLHTVSSHAGDEDDKGDILADNPSDLRTLIKLGSRGIAGWCRPYPVEVVGKVRSFEFDMPTGGFELKIHVPGLEDSEVWKTARGGVGVGVGVGGDEEIQASALVYLPFVHYLKTPGGEGKDDQARIVGEPGTDGMEWVKGEGPALINIKLEFISEGHLEIKGQWARWHYPLRARGGREIYLKLKRST